MKVPRHVFLLALSVFLLTASMTAQKKSSGIVATPSSLDFGNVQVGQSNTQTDVLTNTTTTGLIIYSSTVTGSGFSVSGLPLPLTLAAGQSYTFSSTFAPQASGSVSGSITLSSRNGKSKLVIGLTGNGTAAGTLTVTPTALDFGNVTVGASKALSGTLTAAGSTVNVSAINISTSEFTISGITLPLQITAGKTAGFTITFAPQTSGAAAATASFVSDATNSPTVEALSGMGVSAPQHSVDLAWDPSNTPDVVGYNVYRGTQSGGPYAKINTALDPNTVYDDLSVAAGQTYYYVTTAVDGSGVESTYSNQVKATIPTP